MKLYSILITLIFLSSSLYGQFERNNVVKISPTEFARAEFQVSYERYFMKRRHSVSISPTIILKSEEGDYREGWRAITQYRYYLSHLNEDNGNRLWRFSNIGLYAGVYGLYFDYKDIYDVSYLDADNIQKIVENERKITSIEGGLLVGVQLDITQRFILDFYLGGGIRNSETVNSVEFDESIYNPERGGIYPYGYIGVKPTVGFNLGLLF